MHFRDPVVLTPLSSQDQARLQAEHQGVEELRQRLQEAQTRLEQEPESLRERGESQVREVRPSWGA